jgi:hypothetical protein
MGRISLFQYSPKISFQAELNTFQGRIQDLKLGGGALKKIAPSENFGGISCEKSRFYAKKSYFFQF